MLECVLEIAKAIPVKWNETETRKKLWKDREKKYWWKLLCLKNRTILLNLDDERNSASYIEEHSDVADCVEERHGKHLATILYKPKGSKNRFALKYTC